MMLRVALVLVLLAPSWILAQGEKVPSLVELARKERQRRASSRKAVPVITNATLEKLKRGDSRLPEAVPAEEAVEDQGGEGEAAGESRKQQWEGAFESVRLDLETAVTKGQVLDLRMNDLRRQFYSQDNGVTQARVKEQLRKTQEEIEQNKKATDQARKALQDLQQAARRAGVPPGRIRELSGNIR